MIFPKREQNARSVSSVVLNQRERSMSFSSTCEIRPVKRFHLLIVETAEKDFSILISWWTGRIVLTAVRLIDHILFLFSIWIDSLVSEWSIVTRHEEKGRKRAEKERMCTHDRYIWIDCLCVDARHYFVHHRLWSTSVTYLDVVFNRRTLHTIRFDCTVVRNDSTKEEAGTGGVISSMEVHW